MPFPRAKKSFGQNFLADKSVVRGILVAADIHPGERVLEIGPGTGVLTEALIAAGARVIAVEADAELIPALRERFEGLDLIEADILSARGKDPSLGGRLEEGTYKLVANIPYNITSAVLTDFLARAPRPSRLVLMVQKEVADRIVARPPDMGLLSVVCQLYADVRKALAVPRGAFRPSPKVDSAVVVFSSLRPRRRRGKQSPEIASVAALPRNDEDLEPIIRLAKAGFSSPRKQLHSNLSHAGYGTSGDIKHALEHLGLRPDARAETLSVDDWIRLCGRLNTR